MPLHATALVSCVRHRTLADINDSLDTAVVSWLRHRTLADINDSLDAAVVSCVRHRISADINASLASAVVSCLRHRISADINASLSTAVVSCVRHRISADINASLCHGSGKLFEASYLSCSFVAPAQVMCYTCVSFLLLCWIKFCWCGILFSYSIWSLLPSYSFCSCSRTIMRNLELMNCNAVSEATNVSTSLFI